MLSVAAKSSASPIWTPIVFISETTTCMIAKDELTMKSVILKTINNDDDYDDDDTLHFPQISNLKNSLEKIVQNQNVSS